MSALSDVRATGGVHLVGSLPLPDAETVFRSTAEILGDRLRRVTDGETGNRSFWVGFQMAMLFNHPQLETIPPVEGGPPYPRVQPRADVAVKDIRFDDLGYSRAAKESYEIFSRLQAEGVVPEHWRFQVSLPTPLAVLAIFVMPDSKAELEPAYEDAWRREVEAIAAAIPHDRLAIQWDIAVEIRFLEGEMPAYFTEIEDGVLERILRCASWVPDDVPMGFHLCYGDERHQHFVEPKDLGLLVGLANDVRAGLDRTIEWVHMPVPIERTDEAYFAPLAKLKLHPETEFYLGLIHFRDGDEGAQKRIAAARAAGVGSFGVGTECGMGRRPPERGGTEDGAQQLLSLHARVSDSVG